MIYSSRQISYSIIFFINFLTGIEYAVILPTALQYLKKFGGNQFELGLCISAFSLSSLFSSPAMGKWLDINKNTKRIMIFANMFQIVGSFMYFVGLSSSFLICARLVAGVGLGVIGCCFSDIVKTTNVKERSSILSRIMVGRQVGLIIGPAFNFLLLKLDCDIGPFHLDNLSAPGLLMFLAWIILQTAAVLFYRNLDEFEKDEENSFLSGQSYTSNESSPLNNEQSRLAYNSSNSYNENELEAFIRSGNKLISFHSDETNEVYYSQNEISFSKRIFNEYIREEVVAILFSTFCVFVMLTTIDTFVIPFTQEYFNWAEIQISFYFGLAGLGIVCFYIIHSFVAKRISDKILLLVGLILNVSALTILLAYMHNYKRYRMIYSDKISFLDYLVFMGTTLSATVFSLPLIVVSSISLLSKVTSTTHQGLTQGIRRSFVDIACILGPIWAGTFYNDWYILFGSLIFILSLSTIMISLSFKLLNGKNNEKISLNQ